MKLTYYCLKVEKVITLENGECSHDKQHGCPYKYTPLCWLKPKEKEK